jgi:type IV pilus assembly protein PilP
MECGAKKKIILLSILLAAGTLCVSVPAAESQTDDSMEMEQGLAPGENEEFEYQFANRPDPFLPFIKKDETQQVDPDSEILSDDNKPLRGMQLFEPGQLKLVAVMSVGNEKIALAEDVTGKGYRLNENMPIGRHGVIRRIGDGQVEITETYKTKTGRTVTKEIVMRLKKEGDK